MRLIDEYIDQYIFCPHCSEEVLFDYTSQADQTCEVCDRIIKYEPRAPEAWEFDGE